MAEQPNRSGAAVAGLIILGILFVLPGACGTLFFGAATLEWISNGFHIPRGDLDLGPAIAGLGAFSIVISVILFGLVIRYSRLPSAPGISLALAIIAAIVTLIAPLILLDRVAGPDELVILVLTVIAGILIGVLPPFLFWHKNRQQPVDPAPKDPTHE